MGMKGLKFMTISTYTPSACADIRRFSITNILFLILYAMILLL